MKIRIEKVENGFVVCVPVKDEITKEYTDYDTVDYVYLTLEEVIEKVQEVYGS